MSVLFETSLGDLVIDLDIKNCSKSCLNFLKLCKSYKYNYLTFFSVQKNFLTQSGDPTNSGKGGQSIWSQLPSTSSSFSNLPYFFPERHHSIKHVERGTISMACRKLKEGEDEDENLVAGSQFFITLSEGIEYLDDKHAPFGRIVEGNEKGGTLDKINSAFVDKDNRPLQDIRIQQVVVLDDPFDDPEGLEIPSRTPSPTPDQLSSIGLDASAPLDDQVERPIEEIEEERRLRDRNTAALTLEMVGDLPFAEVRPPENILFVCKLNPITRSEDLELIFSRFGKILNCEVIKDKKSGDSLQYAFIEFDQQQSAEQAYFKMQNVLVDDRRIWVDFSQSVSKLSQNWNASRTKGKRMRVTGAKEDNRNRSQNSTSYHDRRERDGRKDERTSQRSHEKYDRHHEHRRDHRDRDDRHHYSRSYESRDDRRSYRDQDRRERERERSPSRSGRSRY